MDKIMRQWLSSLARNPTKIELDWQNRNIKSINEVISGIIDSKKLLLEDDVDDIFNEARKDSAKMSVQEILKRYGINPKELPPGDIDILEQQFLRRGPEEVIQTLADMEQRKAGTTTPRESQSQSKRQNSQLPSETNRSNSSKGGQSRISTGAQGGLLAGFGAAAASDFIPRIDATIQAVQGRDYLKAIEDAGKALFDVSMMAHGVKATPDLIKAVTPTPMAQAARQAANTLGTEYAPAKAALQASKPVRNFVSQASETLRNLAGPLYAASEAAGVLSDKEKGKPGTEIARRAQEAVPFVLPPSSPYAQRGAAASLLRSGARAATHGFETENYVEAGLGAGLVGAGGVMTVNQDIKTAKNVYKNYPQLVSTAKGAAQDARAAAHYKALLSGAEKATAESIARRAGTKAAITSVTKEIGKAGLKAIPGVNLAVAVPFAATRAAEGDWSGAGLELATAIPFVGLAAQGVLSYRDVQKALEQEREQEKAQNKLRKAEGEVKDIRELMPSEPGRPVRRRDVEKVAVRTGEIRPLAAGPERETEEQKWERRLGIPSVSDEELKTAQTKENPETIENAFKRTYGFAPVFEHAMRAGLLKK